MGMAKFLEWLNKIRWFWLRLRMNPFDQVQLLDQPAAA